MADSSPNVPAAPDPEPWKFKKGNRMGRGNPMGRAVQLFRTQILRELKRKKAVPALVNQLMDMALRGRRRVRYRENVKDADGNVTGTVFRTAYAEVSDKVQLVAVQELLSRGVGKATEFKVIEDNRATTSGTVDLDRVVAMFRTFGTPPETWPLQVREHHARTVTSKVIEQQDPPTEGASQ